MKNKLIFGIIAVVAVAFSAGIFILDNKISNSNSSGKTQKTETTEEAPVEIAQNDYAGSYVRLMQVQNDILEKMQILENHNYEVQKNNPTDYWADDKFYFLDFLPVATGDLKYTESFNEIDNFDDIATYVKGILETDGYTDVVVNKKDNNDYILKYRGFFTNKATWAKDYGYKTMEVKYDAGKNRFKASSSIRFNGANISTNDFFYEFAEIKEGVYALQNDTERLLVYYNKKGKVSKFYYSVLKTNDSQNMLDFFDYEERSELVLNYGFDGTVYAIPDTEDLYIGYMKNNSYKIFKTDTDEYGGLHISEVGESALTGLDGTTVSIVGVKGFYDTDNNSMYKVLSSIDKDWVFEANSFSETISYENKVLSVMTVNDFTGEVSDFSVRDKSNNKNTDSETGTE